VIWPLPALLAWAACWGLFIGLARTGAPPAIALVLAAALGCALALPARTRWRRIFVAAGFPLSLAASGFAGNLPAWAWLLPLVLLVLLYPLNTWRDAPMFPTPADALQGLAQIAPLREGALVLDAGCGLGDGLQELRREYPLARLSGIEWSWPLRLACAWRCRFARVRRGDIWQADWSTQDLVYLFQRPESMPRALEKARRELRPGAWLASLEFEAAGARPSAVLREPGRKPVWLYQAPLA
jgi:SAM-dependent methyltransferase